MDFLPGIYGQMLTNAGSTWRFQSHYKIHNFPVIVLELSQTKKFTLLSRTGLGSYLPDVSKIELVWERTHFSFHLLIYTWLTRFHSKGKKKKWHPYFNKVSGQCSYILRLLIALMKECCTVHPHPGSHLVVPSHWRRYYWQGLWSYDMVKWVGQQMNRN